MISAAVLQDDDEYEEVRSHIWGYTSEVTRVKGDEGCCIWVSEKVAGGRKGGARKRIS
jgi:hypothetical protein